MNHSGCGSSLPNSSPSHLRQRTSQDEHLLLAEGKNPQWTSKKSKNISINIYSTQFGFVLPVTDRLKSKWTELFTVQCSFFNTPLRIVINVSLSSWWWKTKPLEAQHSIYCMKIELLLNSNLITCLVSVTVGYVCTESDHLTSLNGCKSH